MPACQHKKPDGSRCRATALPDKRHCVFHDPASAAKTADGRRKGGEGRSSSAATLPPDTPDAPLATVGDVAAFVAATLNQARTGRLSTGLANCLFVGAGVLVKTLEAADLEKRVADLERRLTQTPNRRAA